MSLIVRASPDSVRGNVAELATGLRGAAADLRSLGAEFILLGDGVETLATLLPTRFRNLRVVRGREHAALGETLNDTALSARGVWLAFARSGAPGTAALLETCCGAEPGTVYLDAAVAPVPVPDGASAQRHGLLCLISREVFQLAGGVDPTLGEPNLWHDLMEKAIALGQRVIGWATPQPVHSFGIRTNAGADFE